MSEIDLELLQKFTAGDNELLADVAVIFVRLWPELQTNIRFGIEHGQKEMIETAAHQFKSRVGYFGALQLQTLASEIESASQRNDLECLQRLQIEVFDGVDRLLDELRKLTDLALIVDEE